MRPMNFVKGLNLLLITKKAVGFIASKKFVGPAEIFQKTVIRR
jgi:hypothetical protein